MAASRVTVVHVVASLDVGGLERVVFDLVKHADRTRFAPRVVCLEDLGALSMAVHRAGHTGRLRRADSVVGWQAEFCAWHSYLREIGADVVHTHNVKPHLHGALAAAPCPACR